MNVQLICLYRFTSPFHKSSLEKKTEKKQAQDAAKQVLEKLKSTKHVAADMPIASTNGQPTVRNYDALTEPSHLRRFTSRSLLRMPPTGHTSDQDAARIHVRYVHRVGKLFASFHTFFQNRRSISEFASDPDAMYQDMGILPIGDQSPSPRISGTLGHVRSPTDPGTRTLPTRLSRVSEIQDHDNVVEPSEAITEQHDDALNNGRERIQQDRSPRVRRSYVGEASGLQPEVGFERTSTRTTNTRTTNRRRSPPPPSYRTVPSTSGQSRPAW